VVDRSVKGKISPMQVSVDRAAPESVQADVLAVAAADGPALGAAGQALDARLGGRLAELSADREIRGSVGQLALVHTGGALAAKRVAVAGVGAGGDADAFRTGAARVAARASALRGGTVAWALDPALSLPLDEQARAVVDGITIGGYDAGLWKTGERESAPIERLLLVADDAGPELDDAVRRAAVAARWTNRCRGLADAPANELTPAALAEHALSLETEPGGVAVESWDRARIEAAGMGAFAAVARGAETEPQLIVMRYEPPGAATDVVLGLVGKAVTFDTGGISLKPPARMDEMKGDMAGGAAVVCALGAVAELSLPLRVLAVVPACENMPDGRAFRPGDIVTALNGKTIEVTNTDAEGRLLLADALTYARREGVTHLVDLATLTGAVVVALGDFYAGLFGNDDAWVERIRRAAAVSGDHAWPLPLHDTYKRLYRSPFADMKNSSDIRQAGSPYAARFLREFTGEGPWAHVDMAGTGHLERTRGDYYTQKGATGYGVRLLVELARGLSEQA
jgi:leucyl aminopeptidase